MGHFSLLTSLSLRPKTETKRLNFGLSPEFRLTNHRSANSLTSSVTSSATHPSLISPYFFSEKVNRFSLFWGKVDCWGQIFFLLHHRWQLWSCLGPEPKLATCHRRNHEVSFMCIVNVLWQSKMAWEGVKFFFNIKNVSTSWDALLHFMNTKMYLWCLYILS